MESSEGVKGMNIFIGQLAQRLAGGRPVLKGHSLHHHSPIVKSRAHLSKVPWVRATLHLQAKRLIIHLLYSKVSALTSKIVTLTLCHNSCESAPGDVMGQCHSWCHWGGHEFWGCSRNRMGLPWRVNDKVITSNGVWSLLGGRSMDTGNRPGWGARCLCDHRLQCRYPSAPVSIGFSRDAL